MTLDINSQPTKDKKTSGTGFHDGSYVRIKTFGNIRDLPSLLRLFRSGGAVMLIFYGQVSLSHSFSLSSPKLKRTLDLGSMSGRTDQPGPRSVGEETSTCET